MRVDVSITFRNKLKVRYTHRRRFIAIQRRPTVTDYILTLILTLTQTRKTLFHLSVNLIFSAITLSLEGVACSTTANDTPNNRRQSYRIQPKTHLRRRPKGMCGAQMSPSILFISMHRANDLRECLGFFPAHLSLSKPKNSSTYSVF